jgi:hypothetical protein
MGSHAPPFLFVASKRGCFNIHIFNIDCIIAAT